jgi:iron complex outermembrane receptor protein
MHHRAICAGVKAGLLTTSALFLLPAAALAQQSTSDASGASANEGIAEIIVTAQRREESLQDVPIAVSAFDEAQLDARNVTDTLDVVQYVPNLVGHNNTGLGSANTYFLRGVGTTESLATQDAPVGTYIDEIYISRQSANNFSLFNVERIEVLRGPQGTLFGRNTTGGAINVILKKPGRDFGGMLEASYGRFDRIAFRGNVDLPVSDTLSTNIAAYFIDDAGYVDNITTGERLLDETSYGVRGAVRFTPTPDFEWDLSGIYSRNESSNLINFVCNPADLDDCDGRFVSTGLRKKNNGANQFAPLTLANGKGNMPLGATTDFLMLSSNVGVDLGGARLNVIAGYVKTDQDYVVDFFDGRAAPTLTIGQDPDTGLPSLYNVSNNIIVDTPVRGFASGGFAIANLATSKQFTLEGKLTGSLFDGFVDYVTGVFFYDEGNVTDFADVLNSSGTPLLLADRIVRNDTVAYAGYGQFDVNVTEQLKLTAGIRYTDETKEFDFFDNRASCNDGTLETTCLDSRNFAQVDVDNNPATPSIEIPLKQRVKIWTPRFAVNFRPNDDVLLFASATRGFKSGSQSARATSVRLLRPFGPEKVWSYEVGAKTDLLDRRLRFNVTGFWADTSDFQGGTAFIDPTTGALSFVTGNIADMRNRGVEIEAQLVPVNGLTFSFSGGYQDIKFIIDRNAPDVNQFGLLSVNAQQAECQAALAGQASPRGDSRTALARARAACTGIVRADGEIADPVRTPEISFTAGVSYEMQFGDGWSITPTVNAIYTGDQEVGTNNLSAFLSDDGVLNLNRDGEPVIGSFSKEHWIVNANLTLRAPDDRYSASLSCDNCFGEVYPQATLSNFSYINPPSTWRLTLRTRF